VASIPPSLPPSISPLHARLVMIQVLSSALKTAKGPFQVTTPILLAHQYPWRSLRWRGDDPEVQMFTVATYDEIVRLGDGLAESGTGAGGIVFLVTFVVVRLLHPCPSCILGPVP
jgi:hypothetical protein